MRTINAHNAVYGEHYEIIGDKKYIMRTSTIKKNEYFFEILIIVTVILSLLSLVGHLVKSGISFFDHQWLWKECACTLRGIDAAQAIKEGLYLEGIGSLPVSTSTFPWTKVIGIFIHGSFLNFKSSCVYFVILNFVVLIMTIVLVYKKLLEEIQNQRIALLGAMLILSSWYLADGILPQNNGVLVCYLIVCIVCTIEKHEWIAGILLGIAMIKPQNVIPFYIVFLLMRKWKAIGTSAAIVFFSWAASVLITGVSPWEQLSNLLNMRVEMQDDYLVYGIFDQLRQVGVDTKIVLFLSMLLGIVVCFLFSKQCIKSEFIVKRCRFILYSAPAIVSVFGFINLYAITLFW